MAEKNCERLNNRGYYRCEVCGKDNLYYIAFFRCQYCGGIFCADHRLPENHNCPLLPKQPPPWVKASLDRMMEQRYGKKHRFITKPHTKSSNQSKKSALSKNKNRMKKTILLFSFPLIILFAYVICPPVITIDSPKSMVYMTNSVPLSYKLVLPQLLNIYNLSYVIDNQPEEPLSNKTLTLPYGNHTLRIYASSDLFGRRRLMLGEVNFTISRVFKSLNELISFLKKDDLNYKEWTVEYTCEDFANEFIRRARTKWYYCFVHLGLYDDELKKYIDTVESIRTTKRYPWGTEIRWYEIPYIEGIGHAVVRTTINGMNVIVDPQTDIILSYPDFKVLYEGEILQE